MDALIRLAEAWWPLYAVHFVEVSLFILLVWAVDRWMTLDTRLRYALYLLALAKVFVPPFFAIPLPEFLMVSDDVPIGPVYADVVSGDEVVASGANCTSPTGVLSVLFVDYFGSGMGGCDVVEECGVSPRSQFGNAG